MDAQGVYLGPSTATNLDRADIGTTPPSWAGRHLDVFRCRVYTVTRAMRAPRATDYWLAPQL